MVSQTIILGHAPILKLFRENFLSLSLSLFETHPPSLSPSLSCSLSWRTRQLWRFPLAGAGVKWIGSGTECSSNLSFYSCPMPHWSTCTHSHTRTRTHARTCGHALSLSHSLLPFIASSKTMCRRQRRRRRHRRFLPFIDSSCFYHFKWNKSRLCHRRRRRNDKSSISRQFSKSEKWKKTRIVDFDLVFQNKFFFLQVFDRMSTRIRIVFKLRL